MTKVEAISITLRENKLRLCAAESFTGGGIASSFVALAGASDIFTLSVVSYAEEAKKRILGVKEQTLKQFGAVSPETVTEMLDGLESYGLGDIFVATSGNAGPTAEKEGDVGLFYVGVSFKGNKRVNKFRHCGSREEVIACGIDKALDLIAETLCIN